MNETRTGWSGWIIFASVMLLIGGIVNAVYGMVAIVNDTWIVWSNQDALLVDFTIWGWVLFAFGVVAVLAGLGLLAGSMTARVAAVVLASLSMIANFLFLPAFPLWALTVMVLDGLVIYAVTTKGREVPRGYVAEEEVIDVRATEGTPIPSAGANQARRTPIR